MNKSKKWLLSGLGALTLLFMVAPAFAASYTAYVLPPLSGNNYTSAHSKKTTSNAIKNTVTALTNTDRANFWACDNTKKQLSTTYTQKLGSTTDIIHGKTQIGYQIIMGMENARLQTSNAFVSGNVDFR